jgi:hypothetical protein
MGGSRQRVEAGLWRARHTRRPVCACEPLYPRPSTPAPTHPPHPPPRAWKKMFCTRVPATSLDSPGRWALAMMVLRAELRNWAGGGEGERGVRE